MFNTDTELALRLALGVGLVSIAVSIALVLQVIVMRLQGVRRARRLAELRARWRPVLAKSALGHADAVTLPALARRDRADVLVLWNQLQDGLRGSAHAGLNRVAERLGFHAEARRHARRGGLAEQVLGLATIGHLGHPDDNARLHAALGDVQSLISLGAARALLQVDAVAAAPLVIDQYLKRGDWPAARLGTLLRDAGADAVAPPLTQRLLAGDVEAQLRLLPLLRFAESPHAGSVLHALVERSDDPRVLSLALRQLRGPEALPRVRTLAASSDALVRSAAAQALGHIGSAEDGALLVSMMSDRDWWVRYRAAQARLALPHSSEAGLDALRRELSDRYARDALDHVRAEAAMEAAAPLVPAGAAS